MTKQTKKQICESKATLAYYSGLGGLETKYIEYDIDDYMYLVSGVWHGKRAYHRLKIHYGVKTSIYAYTGKDARFPNLSVLKSFTARPFGRAVFLFFGVFLLPALCCITKRPACQAQENIA